MTVFRTRSFVPLSIIAEKVSEPAVRRIKPVLQKRQITCREIRQRQMCVLPDIVLQLIVFGSIFLGSMLAHMLQHHRENECAGIIVGSVTLASIRYGKDCML